MKKAFIKFKSLLILGAVLVMVSSCQYDEVLPQVVELPDDPVSYELDIQPFFDAKCTQCHAGSIAPNLSAGVSYDELINNNWINTTTPASSPLYQSIDLGGSMETYASPTERALLLKWIEQGASNN